MTSSKCPKLECFLQAESAPPYWGQLPGRSTAQWHRQVKFCRRGSSTKIHCSFLETSSDRIHHFFFFDSQEDFKKKCRFDFRFLAVRVQKMGRRATLTSGRRGRTLFTFVWIGALAIIAIMLIYYEMTALLYILATLGVTGLLIVVAVADLARSQNMSIDTPQLEKVAAATASTGTSSNKQS